ncbi:hypothetical protein ACS0TY_008969 [Phlomoides rotata]
MKRQLEANGIVGIRPCKNRPAKLFQGTVGLDQRRRLRLQLKDGNFLYSMDLDQDGRLCNVLWIHPRCRVAYEEFYDDTRHISSIGCALVTHEDA